MSQRNADKPEIEWKVGDVRNMSDFADNTIDIAIDKGTLDAMIYGSLWDPPEEVVENTKRYIDEVRLTTTKHSLHVYWSGPTVSKGCAGPKARRYIPLCHISPTALHEKVLNTR